MSSDSPTPPKNSGTAAAAPAPATKTAPVLKLSTLTPVPPMTPAPSSPSQQAAHFDPPRPTQPLLKGDTRKINLQAAPTNAKSSDSTNSGLIVTPPTSSSTAPAPAAAGKMELKPAPLSILLAPPGSTITPPEARPAPAASPAPTPATPAPPANSAGTLAPAPAVSSPPAAAPSTPAPVAPTPPASKPETQRLPALATPAASKLEFKPLPGSAAAPAPAPVSKPDPKPAPAPVTKPAPASASVTPPPAAAAPTPAPIKTTAPAAAPTSAPIKTAAPAAVTAIATTTAPAPAKAPEPAKTSPKPAKEPAPAVTAVTAAPAKPAKTPETAPAPPPEEAGLGALGFILLVIGLPLLLAVALVLIYFIAIKPRMAASGALTQEQHFNTERVVVYAVARQATPKVELPLPGAVEAYQQASIFARTNGYVKKWLVDIGDVVHEGDLMAELDTPDIDAELNQAKATAEQAKASLAIAQTAADRWNAMVAQHAVSQEEADEKNATRDEAKATLDADLANVAHLTDEENFKEIRAPFTGTITYRNIDVGNLVSAGNGSSVTGTTEMYRVAQTDPLRVFVNVPEANTPSIHPGVEADLHVAAYPNRVFKGEVVRSAGALDPASRTLNTEIRVQNPDGALLPGAYAEVRLQLVDSAPTVLIPANTLIVNASGTQVAVIENNDGRDIVHVLPVKVGRDFGTEVEILNAVQPGDRLVTNPPADLADGTVVTAKALPPPATPPPTSSAPAPLQKS